MSKTKARFLKLFFLTSLCVAVNYAYAQAPSKGTAKRDVFEVALEAARAEQGKGNIRSAFQGLHQVISQRKYQKINPEIVWYTAQLAYLNQENAIATEYYERALKELPNNSSLIEDYGGFLMNTREYRSAIAVLKPHQETPLAKLYLARTYYWQGNYAAAKAVVKTFSAAERKEDYIKSFLYEFNLAKATQLRVDFGYRSDDQPLRSTMESIALSKKINNLLYPFIQTSFSQFSEIGDVPSSFLLRAGNQIHINPLQTDIKIGLGSFRAASASTFLFQFHTRTKISGNFSLDLNYSREPYLYTPSSARSLVSFDEKYVAFNVDNFKGILGRIQYGSQVFEKNNINSFSAWTLFPIIRRKHFTARVGYAFQHSNADSSTISPKDPVTSIGQEVVGIYNPYFTPKNQVVHSALVQIQFNPTSRLTTGVTASLPLSANIDNPYLYTLYDANGNIALEKGFARTKYQPVDLKLALGYKFTDVFQLDVNYQYASLFFYKGNFFNIGTQLLIK